MSNQSVTSDDNPFDVTRIRQLVRLMRDNDLSEIDLRWVDARIRLRRGAEQVITAAVTPQPAVSQSVGEPRPAPAPSNEPPLVSANDYVTITSPIVGTFYAAPSPDAERFVTVGSKVTPESVVCIVEAMKVFNEIPAGVSGTIREILVEDGTAVEYGQPLFHVETS